MLFFPSHSRETVPWKIFLETECKIGHCPEHHNGTNRHSCAVDKEETGGDPPTYPPPPPDRKSSCCNAAQSQRPANVDIDEFRRKIRRELHNRHKQRRLHSCICLVKLLQRLWCKPEDESREDDVHQRPFQRMNPATNLKVVEPRPAGKARRHDVLRPDSDEWESVEQYSARHEWLRRAACTACEA